LTFRPQPGHIGSDSAASHAGQIFHPGSTGSPQAGQDFCSSDIFHFMLVVGGFSRSRNEGTAKMEMISKLFTETIDRHSFRLRLVSHRPAPSPPEADKHRRNGRKENERLKRKNFRKRLNR
jgi:hypothetical protein